MGARPLGKVAMTNVERQRKYRQNLKKQISITYPELREKIRDLTDENRRLKIELRYCKEEFKAIKQRMLSIVRG